MSNLPLTSDTLTNVNPLVNEESLKRIEEENEVDEIESDSAEEVLPPEEEELETYRRENQKLKKEKYRIAGENQQLARIVEEQHLWKQQVDQHLAQSNQALAQSTQAAMGHYEEGLQLKLREATKAKEKALEDGDMKAVLQADIDLTRAVTQIENLQRYHSEKEAEARYAQEIMLAQQQQQQQQQPYYAPPQPAMVPPEAEDWIRKNTWYVPGHPNFDFEKAEQVHAFAKLLDRKLAREGRQNEYFTDAYFAEIENFVAQSFGTQSKGFKMKPSGSSVAPVRHTTSSYGTQQRERIVLSDLEKEIARNMGYSDSDWIRAKRDVQQINKQKGRRNDR